MLLFGITGGIGHGKSTLAAALAHERPQAARHFETFDLIADVGNKLNHSTKQLPASTNLDSINEWLEPLPTILAEAVHAHASFAQISIDSTLFSADNVDYLKLIHYIETLEADPSLLQHDITENNKETYRGLLQWLGGYLVAKVDNGIWYKEIIRRVQAAEANGTQLCTIGGVRYPNDAALVREAGGYILGITRPAFPNPDSSDPTESSRRAIIVDAKVINNGVVADIEPVARIIMNDAESGHLQKTYITKIDR
jgi:hypothetical protein